MMVHHLPSYPPLRDSSSVLSPLIPPSTLPHTHITHRADGVEGLLRNDRNKSQVITQCHYFITQQNFLRGIQKEGRTDCTGGRNFATKREKKDFFDR